MKAPQYAVFLFPSVSHVLKAEKILIAASIAHKLIPVPRQISSDCGVCIRVAVDRQDQATAVLREKIAWEGLALL
jgi:hypothetical protein